MANVLPKDMQKKVWRSFRARFVTTGALILIVSALLALLALAPSYVALRLEEGSMPPVPAAGSAKTVADDKAQIAKVQFLATLVGAVIAATSTPDETMEHVYAAKSADIRIDQLLYTPGATSTLSISGIGSNGDSVNSFRSAVAQSGEFKSVSVPVDSLLGSRDGHFTMTILGTF